MKSSFHERAFLAYRRRLTDVHRAPVFVLDRQLFSTEDAFAYAPKHDRGADRGAK
jgi:hypothetical protein